jgi:hypothetical protein
MKWVSVSKKLPRWGEQVIVAGRRYSWSNVTHSYRKCKKLGVTIATYWREDDRGPRFTEGQNHVVQEPVAWMPLPEPPEAG